MLCPEETPEGIHWFKGTADAVRQNLQHLIHDAVDYYLILSGDQLYNLDLLKMVQFAKERQADLVIATIPVQEAEAKRMGLLQTHNDGKIFDFIEKPTDPKVLQAFQIPSSIGASPLYLGSMGIYVFRKEALIRLLKEEGDDFGKHLIPLMIAQKKAAYAFIYDGYWEDIGTVASYYQANLALLSQHQCLNTNDPNNPIYTGPEHLPSAVIKGTRIESSLISQGCVIEAEEITNSLIGLCTKIQTGTIIKDSVIIGSPGVYLPKEDQWHIGKNCLIQKAILDEQAQIGHRVTLTNQKNLIHYDGDGVFIRDGIIIVTSGANIPDGFTL